MHPPRSLVRWLALLPVVLLVAGCSFVIDPEAVQTPGAETPVSATPAAEETPTPAEETPAAAETPAAEETPAAAETPAAQAAESDFTLGLAPIENVEVQLLESFPVQAQVRVEGYLPDGCTELLAPTVMQQMGMFLITLPTQRPTDAICTQQIIPFDVTIPIDIAGLAAGTYSVSVNDQLTTFALATDNVLAPGEAAPGAIPDTDTETVTETITTTETQGSTIPTQPVDDPQDDPQTMAIEAQNHLAQSLEIDPTLVIVEHVQVLDESGIIGIILSVDELLFEYLAQNGQVIPVAMGVPRPTD